MLSYLIACYKKHSIKFIGVITLPCAFLMIGLGLMANPQIQNLPATFHTLWLIVHILFAKITVGSGFIALGCSIFYLIKAKKKSGNTFVQKLPDPVSLDSYSFQFFGMAFVFWTISVIAGAIWAHKSWGRYWAWDPIETWSLLTWLAFGIYMHLRRFHGLKEKKAAIFIICCFGLVILTLFLVPFITNTVHTEYML
nr:cytochrome c biogenesis protein CcsA [Desulfobulbaceae bacterium]